ncbi:MAG: metallophosphoesterase [Rhizobiaceae bacterium]
MSGIHFLDAKGPDGVHLFAIGDVHGRLDLLQAMHRRIAERIAEAQLPDWRIIHLGDYVDRGPNAKGVLDHLIERQGEDPRFVALAGNHDVGFLDFLAMPDTRGLFANWGGDATALSYGVHADFRDPVRLRHVHAALSRAVPGRHLRFLEALGFSASFGDFFFCHAGIRPGVGLDAQSPDDLVWIRDKFLNHASLHPKVIVHGHTPQPEPEILPNRINVDTLAYQSGVLTALEIEGASKRILTVSDRRT